LSEHSGVIVANDSRQAKLMINDEKSGIVLVKAVESERGGRVLGSDHGQEKMDYG
jgi:hypothetical protein